MTDMETNTTIHVFVKPRVTVADDKIWIVCDKPDGDTIMIAFKYISDAYTCAKDLSERCLEQYEKVSKAPARK